VPEESDILKVMDEMEARSNHPLGLQRIEEFIVQSE